MSTTISKNLKKTTAFITKTGEVLEGVNVKQFKTGDYVRPQEESKEEKKARLLQELAELE